MFSTQDLKQTRFYQEVVQEGIQLGKQEGIQIGEQRGIQLGKQEGIQLGEAELAIRQLRRKFGALSDDQFQRIRTLRVQILEAKGEALLDFTTVRVALRSNE